VRGLFFYTWNKTKSPGVFNSETQDAGSQMMEYKNDSDSKISDLQFIDMTLSHGDHMFRLAYSKVGNHLDAADPGARNLIAYSRGNNGGLFDGMQ